MQKDFFRIIRILAIDRKLSEDGKAGKKELQKFCKNLFAGMDYTLSDLEDDMEFLKSPAGEGYSAPVEYDSEEEMYSYNNASFSIKKTRTLNDSEQEFLGLCILYLDLLKSRKIMEPLVGTIQKLVDTMQIRLEGKKAELPEYVSSELPSPSAGNKFLSPLIRSIRDRKVVRLYYQPFYEDKPYFTNVHPYLLKEFKGRWYLIGLNDTRRQIRTYGLDRIWEIETIERDYISRDFMPSDYFKNTVGVISPMGEPPEILVEVSSHQSKYLITQPLHESQYIEKEDDNYTIFGYRVHPTWEFKSLILALGKEARVLKPVEFQKEILNELNEAILAYGRS